MARTYAQEGIAGLSQKTDFGLRLTLAVALPAILIVSAVGIPLISAFFERGAFSPADTYGVSRILFAFLVGDVLIRMLGNIFERGFFTLKNTITPPVVSSIFVILFIASARYFVTHWGYIGIVWANVTRQGLEALTVGILLFRKFPKDQRSFIIILRYLLAALASFVVGRVIVLGLVDFSIYIQLIVGGSLSALLYFLILYSIDKEILRYIFQLFGVSNILEKLHIGAGWFGPKTPWLNGRNRS
jgi:peptidoglycan biosynthesis protein MviN/MurJ (putative lipid II flippase)